MAEEQNQRRKRAKAAPGAETEATGDHETDSKPVRKPRTKRNVVQEVRKDALADPRTAIADALAAYLSPEQVERLVDEILAIHKRVPVKLECDYCGRAKSAYVEVPDAKAVVSALTELLSQGFGRPDVAKMEKDLVTIRRFTDLTEWEARDDENAAS